MHIRYRVALTVAERSSLQQVTSQRKHRARAIKRAQILLMSDGQEMTDGAGKQLVREVQTGKSMSPGQVSKVDYEYERKGVANIYLCFDRHRGWRHAKVRQSKKAADFAELMRELVDGLCPYIT